MSITHIPRLPKPPQKLYSPKHMSIGIGFQTINGLVLGADRQMTRPGLNKFFEQKVFYDSGSSDRMLALVGADDLALAKEVWNKLLKCPCEPTVAATRDIFEAILNEMGRLYTDLPLELLLGIATKDEVELIEFRGKGLQSIAEFEFAVIGCGDSSLVRYLADHTDKFLVGEKQAILTATYILKRAEEYVDGCHGPMDIVSLSIGPKIKMFDSSVLEDIDKHIQEREWKAFKTLLSVSSPT